MKSIINASTSFIDVLNTQSIADGKSYRLLTYCLGQPCDAGVLLYNTLSCEMVLLQEHEVDNMLSHPYLVEHWFVVPEDFDDRKLALEYRNIRELLNGRNTDVCRYTILPTTDCNARCFYCYELGRSRIMMTEATAHRVADYIIGNYKSMHDGEKADVTLDWFGGEPLYNYKAIDIICSSLKKAGVPFRSKMVSNAFLFDDDLVGKAASLWNLKSVQVTLDGTEDTYNRCKAYINSDGSAYQRVIRNIGLLLVADISVTVRMNIDMHNADDLKSLALQLKERFDGNEKITCYTHPLFEVASPAAHVRTEERRQLVYQKQQELRSLLEEQGLSRRSAKLPKDIPFNLCKADGGRSVVIAPTGQIGLCEHYTESEFFSHIDTPNQRDEAVIARFRERCEDIDLCHDCPVYPQCIRLKMCEEGSLCFPEIRAEKTENIRKAMIAKYESWKAKREETEEEDVMEEC